MAKADRNKGAIKRMINKRNHIVKVDPYTLQSRMQQLIDEQNLTKRELAIKGGVSYSLIFYTLQGQRETYQTNTLERIAEALGTSYGWLTGKDPKATKYKVLKENAKTPELPSNNLFKACETPEAPRIIPEQQQKISATKLVAAIKEAVREVIKEELKSNTYIVKKED